MARKSAAVRREEILAATVEEIEATGLRALRVSDVAARLGLSASLVIYHFETKEALVAEAFDFAGRQDIDRARELAAGTASAGTDAPHDGGGDATTGSRLGEGGSAPSDCGMLSAGTCPAGPRAVGRSGSTRGRPDSF